MNRMGKKWTIEFLTWVVAAIIALLLVLPIINNDVSFEWLWFNVGFAVVSVVLLRYLFLFDSHPLRHSKLFKVLLIFAVPVSFFAIIEGLHSFLEFGDQVGIDTLMPHLSYEKASWLASYIQKEYLVVGVTCLFGMFALIIKMIRSLWRQFKFAAYH